MRLYGQNAEPYLLTLGMAIDQQLLQYLLERNKTQTSTAAERAELEQWYQESENQANFTEGLSNTAQKFLEDRLLSGIDARISQQEKDQPLITVHKPAVSWGSGLYRIAAVFLGLLLVTALIYQ